MYCGEVSMFICLTCLVHSNITAEYEHNTKTVETFNPVMHDMITGMSGTEILTESKLMFITIFECIYKTVHNNTIAPHHFRLISDVEIWLSHSFHEGAIRQCRISWTRILNILTTQIIGKPWNIHLGHNKPKMSNLPTDIQVKTDLSPAQLAWYLLCNWQVIPKIKRKNYLDHDQWKYGTIG